MAKKLSVLLSLLFMAQLLVMAQQKLPLVKATSVSVDIKDGGVFTKMHGDVVQCQ